MPASNVKYEPNDRLRAEVSALRSFGHTHKEIASHLGICDDTMIKYYKDELDNAVLRANARVANKLYRRATESDDLQAQIFWLKTRARWRTTDSDSVIESNTLLQDQVMSLRMELDAKNKKEY